MRYFFSRTYTFCKRTLLGYSTVQYSTVYTVLCCTVLCWTGLYCTVRYGTGGGNRKKYLKEKKNCSNSRDPSTVSIILHLARVNVAEIFEKKFDQAQQTFCKCTFFVHVHCQFTLCGNRYNQKLEGETKTTALLPGIYIKIVYISSPTGRSKLSITCINPEKITIGQ